MTDDVNDNAPPSLNVLEREEYAKNLIDEHIALGFPPEAAATVADKALQLADKAQDAISALGDEILGPLRDSHPPIIGTAALHAATRLISTRMEFVRQQAAAHAQMLMQPPEDQLTQH